jgi:hypothetical protein
MTDLFDGRLTCILIHITDHDMGPFFGKAHGSGFADTGGTTGDQANFIL